MQEEPASAKISLKLLNKPSAKMALGKINPVRNFRWGIISNRVKKHKFLCSGITAVFLIALIVISLGFEEDKKHNFLTLLPNQFTGSPFISQQQVGRIESPDLYIIQGSALKGVAVLTTLTPQVLGGLVGTEEVFDANKEVIEYIVEQGDTLSSISAKHNISLETLLWANNLTAKSTLKIGKKLVILPVSGIMHHVGKGETISGIAELYKSKSSDIIDFNDLLSGGEIFVSDILIIPNGKKPAAARIAPRLAPLATSYFICPIGAPCKVTQNLHWYNAIDFSHGKCGEPIYAAAGGAVLKVMTTQSTSKWAFSGAGNHIKILHPNGVVTFYGHISKTFVAPGQQVSQGQMIALVGGKPGSPGAGRSTGCHVHFGVHGARNPFAK